MFAPAPPPRAATQPRRRRAAAATPRFGPGGWATTAAADVDDAMALAIDLAVPAPPAYQEVDAAYDAFRQASFVSAADKRDYTRQCILCRYGDRVVDASAHGSRLFVEMINLVEQRLPTMRPEEIVNMIVHYIDAKIRPAFRDADIPCPVPEAIDRALLYEHLTTSQHTCNSRLMCVNVARLLDRMMLRMSSFVFPVAGPPDPRMAEMVMKFAKTIKSFHETQVARLAFGSGGRGDDVGVDVDQAPIASGIAVRRIGRQRGAFVSRYMTDFNQAAATAEEDEADEDAAAAAAPDF